MAWKRFSSSEVVDIYHNTTEPVLNTQNLDVMDGFIQHGATTCLRHSMAVAFYSLKLVCFLNIRCNHHSLVRGALLHDYFLYDWHYDDGSHRFHGFSHPRTALNNASRDFDLNDIERDIISKHMFPLVPMPPLYRESIIVSLIDKYCSIREIFSTSPYNAMPDMVGFLGVEQPDAI